MRRIVLSLLVGLAGLGPVRGQEPVVWVASPWEHVLRTTEPGKARSAEIVAARNEYESLRVIIRAGGETLANVQVEASKLVGAAAEIEAGSVALFREHYMDVFKPSPRSKAPAGWYPDALVPIGGGKPAVLSVEPGMNQGIWVDVYIPRGTAPGDYSGTITVTADSAKLASVPVKVHVQPFTLPDTIAMRSNFGSLGGRLAQHLGIDAGSEEFTAVETSTCSWPTGQFPRRWETSGPSGRRKGASTTAPAASGCG